MIELSLLLLLVIICGVFVQALLLPFNLINSLQLPLPLWLGTVETWLGLGLILFLGAWLLGDR